MTTLAAVASLPAQSAWTSSISIIVVQVRAVSQKTDSTDSRRQPRVRKLNRGIARKRARQVTLLAYNAGQKKPLLM